MQNLEYRKPTRREGTEALLVAGATLVVLGGVMAALLAFGQVEWAFAVVWFVILAIIGLLALVYAWLNVAARREFVCRLDDQNLECISPVPGCGETFKIALGDIAAIERESWSNSCRWYVCDSNGRQYWLTANYDNPVDQFLARIRERNPAVKELESRSSSPNRVG